MELQKIFDAYCYFQLISYCEFCICFTLNMLHELEAMYGQIQLCLLDLGG